MTIADQIRALEKGQRVRVRIEDVVTATPDGCVALLNADVSHCVITSIEVIERPLAVGDRFERNGEIGEVLALHGEYAWMLWGVYGHSVTKTKVVNSYRRVTP